MYISPKASLARQREAQKARDNRAEIVKARSLGQITRRDLAPALRPVRPTAEAARPSSPPLMAMVPSVSAAWEAAE